MPSSEQRLARQLVAEREAGLEVGRATRLELVDGGHDPVVVGRAGRWEHDARVIAERHDRDRIAPAEAADQLSQRVLDQLEPVLARHRAGGVDDEREGGRGPRTRVRSRGP